MFNDFSCKLYEDEKSNLTNTINYLKKQEENMSNLLVIKNNEMSSERNKVEDRLKDITKEKDD
jgi:uncharacterized protein YeeX (DUF496 family)